MIESPSFTLSWKVLAIFPQPSNSMKSASGYSFPLALKFLVDYLSEFYCPDAILVKNATKAHTLSGVMFSIPVNNPSENCPTA